MKITKFVLAAITVAAASITSAQTSSSSWKLAYKDKDVSVFLDTAQIKTYKDKSSKIFLKWEYAKDQRIDGKTNYRTMIDERIIKCSNLSSKPVTATTMDSKGKIVSAYNIPAKERATMDWQGRKKGTSSLKAYEAVCKSMLL